MVIEFLAFSDKHPAVAVVFSATIAILATVAYCALARVLETVQALAGRRRVKKEVSVPTPPQVAEEKPVRKQNTIAAPVNRREIVIRSALGNLGYQKAEVDPVMDELDLNADVASIMRTAIKKLNARASEVS